MLTSQQTPVIQKTEGPKTVITRAIIGHLMLLGVFFVPLTAALALVAFIGFFVREFAIEGLAHRYFSHRVFKTTRAFQFVCGVLVAASAQRGPVWWATHHRKHHRFADGEGDPYYSSTTHHPRWYALFGWLLTPGALDTPMNEAKDLAKFPELVWINKHHYLFPLGTMALTFAIGHYTAAFGATDMGWAGLIWGFFVPTVLSQHTAYWVGALAHGTEPGALNVRQFETPDTTTNLRWFSIPTMGGSYHNNHHRFMNAARSGFYPGEIDLAYATFKVLEALHLIWDLNPVPEHVLLEGLPSHSSTEDVAAEL